MQVEFVRKLENRKEGREQAKIIQDVKSLGVRTEKKTIYCSVPGVSQKKKQQPFFRFLLVGDSLRDQHCRYFIIPVLNAKCFLKEIVTTVCWDELQHLV